MSQLVAGVPISGSFVDYLTVVFHDQGQCFFSNLNSVNYFVYTKHICAGITYMCVHSGSELLNKLRDAVG